MTEAAAAALAAALKRDRAITLVALAVVITGSWMWVLAGAGMGMTAFQMSGFGMALGGGAAGQGGGMAMDGMGFMASGEIRSAAPSERDAMADATADSLMPGMPMATGWGPGYAAMMVFMWWTMMLAMMLPSAAPAILLFAVLRRKSSDTKPQRSTLAFAAAYGAAWLVFSILAALCQWGLEAAGALSPMLMNATSLPLASAVLLAAGIYQFTPVKDACLRHCRAPAEFLSEHWRPHTDGAFRMGALHGLYCLGCCWALMALLFFGGVMNLWWIGLLAALVFIEKLSPPGARIGQAAGLIFMAGGIYLAWLAIA